MAFPNPSPMSQVFINFGGDDLRCQFLPHLMSEFKTKQICIDVEKRSDDFAETVQSIKESKIALVIISSMYTNSSWCLNELVEITRRVEEGKLVAIPILYKVDASVVKRLEGDFGLNLWNHVKRTSEFDNLKKWKEALDFILHKLTLVLRENSDEPQFITRIVKEVKRQLIRISTDQFKKIPDQQEKYALTDACFSRSKEPKTVDNETDVNPAKTEFNGKSRKDENLPDEGNDDATPNLQNIVERRSVDSAKEEKKYVQVGEGSTMGNYDKHVPQHQVFINFQGEDVRFGFVSPLVSALLDKGIKAFIDKDERRGEEEDIGKLFKKIKDSKIALVVFSSSYSESTWCLDELVKIKECMDEGKLKVIPIFHKVEPSEVQQLNGDFGCKLWNLWRLHHDHRIIKWMEALESVASIKGINSQEHISESELITVTVKEALETISIWEGEITELPTEKEEKHETYLDQHHLFGMEQRMEHLEKKLEFDCNETRIIGVVGMPGIGKTTLAMMLYEKWNCKFIRCLPLLGIRKKSEDHGTVWLRKTLLEVLLEGKFPVISDKTTQESVKDKLLQAKVFVVLDDVTDKKQLEFLLGDLGWIKKGSKIVITTCDKSLIEGLAHDAYVVPVLNDREAFQLFNYQAFDDQICSPTDTFLTLSRRFLDYARGLPLALILLGKELRGKDKAHWEHKLVTLTSSSMMFQDVWRFSIDQLNERQKDVFLDITCFFNSEDEYFVRSLLDSGDPDNINTVSEVRDLANKFLITISDSRVQMNDLLYTFGKDLGSPRWLRLWNYEDFMTELKTLKKSDANNVRGIFLDMSKLTTRAYMDRLAFTDMGNLLYLKIYDSCCPQHCKADSNLYFPDGLCFRLEKVKYLDWLKFPLQELPSDFRPENLVDLRLPYSKIERVWKGVKDTPQLKWVDLRHSSKLLDLSALANAENLQRLNLEGCTNLDKLPEDMQNMKSLVYLNMKGCICLGSLPEINLISLKTLILSGCLNLEVFSVISENLEILHLDGTAIKELPPAIKKLQKLILLNLKNCKMLKCLPKCLGELKALEELILSDCLGIENVKEIMKHLQSLLLDRIGAKEMPTILGVTKSKEQASADLLVESIGLRKWPVDVSGISKLQRLSLSGNDFVYLKKDIGQLYNLKWLDVKQCKKLRSIPMLPPRLQYFDACGCDSLETVANPLAFPMLSEQIQATFNFTNCIKLDEYAKDSIMSYTRWRSQLALDEFTLYNESSILEAFTGTCFPGSEVPAWFSHQASGSVLEPKLPPHWSDNRLTGIAMCAVISFNGFYEQKSRFVVTCNCVFNGKDGSCIRFSCTVGSWSKPRDTPGMIEPSHVFIGYTSILDIKKYGEDKDEEGCSHTKASFEFQVTDGTDVLEGCEVLKCGFSLVYATDERENIGWDGKTDSSGRVDMHDQLYTLGKDRSYHRCYWLSNYKDFDKLTKMKQQDANNVEGIFLDMNELTESVALECMTFTGMGNLVYLKIYNSCCPRHCKADSNLYFPDGLDFRLEKVKYLDWLKFPLQELPSDFRPENLVDLRLPYSKIERLWEAIQEFQLISESVEVLHLDGTTIKGLPPAIQHLQRLVVLNLKNCKMLECLPKCLGTLKFLDELTLSGCSRLRNLQDVRNSLKHLQILNFDGTGANKMPSISCFIGSEDPASTDTLPFGLYSTLREWPGVNGVSSLRHLCLSGNNFLSLEPDIWKLCNLKWLDVKQCKKLRFVPMLPPRLQYFDARGCDSLERVSNPLAFPMFSEKIHATFNFSNCNKLDQDAKNSIISYARLRSYLMLDELNCYNEGSIFTETCYPGWEVPAWFSHQASGPTLKPKLPPHWNNNRFTGIALCAVISFPDCHEQKNTLLVKCNCVLNNEDGSHICFSCTIGSWSKSSNTPDVIQPTHVFIGYSNTFDMKKGNEEDEEGCSYIEGLVEFQVTDGTEVLKGYEVQKCGFSLYDNIDEPQDNSRVCRALVESNHNIAYSKTVAISNVRRESETAERSLAEGHEIATSSQPPITKSQVSPPKCETELNNLGRERYVRTSDVDTRLSAEPEQHNTDLRIEESKIALAIFSKRYIESDFCLNELVTMDKLAKEGKLVVIPVFYNVRSSDVKNLKGEFGRYFEEMRVRYKDEPEKVFLWETSVKSIAKTIDKHSELNGEDAPLVEATVQEVQRALRNTVEGNPKSLGGGNMAIDHGFAFIMVFLMCLFTYPLPSIDEFFFSTGKWLLDFLLLAVGVVCGHLKIFGWRGQKEQSSDNNNICKYWFGTFLYSAWLVYSMLYFSNIIRRMTMYYY
ncbi:unnamed protein product [Thlaspi arvense]|uniref:ADP-ribosyl cyclase/cyclic ADP-ribose hydrolase n=1 Tax=Thlaspi arvense TaxID=13288 RepID=A0AAU9RME4_THLAR|nr:unnamed protein product [Thlaspi arvense]